MGYKEKEIIFKEIEKFIDEILLHNRVDDENLKIGKIEEMIDNGELSISEITRHFEESLIKGLPDGI
jgi:hypothetical protein